MFWRGDTSVQVILAVSGPVRHYVSPEETTGTEHLDTEEGDPQRQTQR